MRKIKISAIAIFIAASFSLLAVMRTKTNQRCRQRLAMQDSVRRMNELNWLILSYESEDRDTINHLADVYEINCVRMENIIYELNQFDNGESK